MSVLPKLWNLKTKATIDTFIVPGYFWFVWLWNSNKTFEQRIFFHVFLSGKMLL